MVNLPSNRVRFGKDAYQDVSYVGEAVEEKIVEPVTDFFTQPFDIMNARKRAEFMGQEADIFDERYGSPFNLDIYTDYFKPGQASAFLKETDQRKEDFESSLNKPEKKEEKKTKRKDPDRDTPKPKKPKGEDLYRSPEEAAYASLIDSDAGQQAAKRYFGGENLALANISEALKAYKGFKDTEMEQLRKIDKAKKATAAATAKAKRERLGDQLTLAKIKSQLNSTDQAALSALAKALENSTDEAEIARINAQIQTLAMKAMSSPIDEVAIGSGIQYAGRPSVVNRIAERNRAAKE
tara:strand:- start:735 stop:1619 length:885 start_codon:yes stop_codon:yes gene_type:complete